jgi:hypothetical protein
MGGRQENQHNRQAGAPGGEGKPAPGGKTGAGALSNSKRG